MSDLPTELKSGRMSPLARLPAFFALAGKRAVVAGGGQAAAWKAELLSASGAAVDVFAPHAGEDMRALATVPPDGAIILHQRAWNAADLSGAAIAVAECENDHEAARFAAAARAAGVPVNVIDRPAFCDFSFGAIVNRSPLVIGISTDGAAPVFGQAIRAKIEALIPKGFARWAEAARNWRPRVQALALSFRGRRNLWETFAARAVAAPDDAPTESDFAALLTTRDTAAVAGSVILVGAGPGDPELLTLRAVRALQSADVILFDHLVSPAILDFARREARKMLVGKTGHAPSCKQDDINAMMVSLAVEGKRVVRLKGGDPLIFGRAGEEIAACRAAGVRVEVIPGITAASGAAASLEVSLTHRDHARRLQYITAHAKNGKLPADIDWKALVDPAATTAIYMGKLVVGEVAANLAAAGIDPQVPAIIVEYATLARERRFHCTIGTMAEVFANETLDGPCVILFGWAMSEARLEDIVAPAT